MKTFQWFACEPDVQCVTVGVDKKRGSGEGSSGGHFQESAGPALKHGTDAYIKDVSKLQTLVSPCCREMLQRSVAVAYTEMWRSWRSRVENVVIVLALIMELQFWVYFANQLECKLARGEVGRCKLSVFEFYVSDVSMLMMVVPGFACVCPETGLEEVSRKLSILNALCLRGMCAMLLCSRELRCLCDDLYRFQDLYVDGYVLQL